MNACNKADGVVEDVRGFKLILLQMDLPWIDSATYKKQPGRERCRIENMGASLGYRCAGSVDLNLDSEGAHPALDCHILNAGSAE